MKRDFDAPLDVLKEWKAARAFRRGPRAFRPVQNSDRQRCERVGKLPLLDKDPFDRILVAQAQHDGLTIITPDPRIRKYDVPTLW